MVIIHIESGLGNQMLSYCEYLALKKINPNDQFYLETMIFDIPECNDVICQWNGYELERIFGIKEPQNIRSLFTNEQWKNILEEVRLSKFWEKNWNYPVYITQALNKQGLDLENIRGDFEAGTKINKASIAYKMRRLVFDSWLGIFVKNKQEIFQPEKRIAKYENKCNLFTKTNRNLFTGQWLSFYRKGNNRELIDDIIRETFRFPEFIDEKDFSAANVMSEKNSVAIHVRRGDALYSNAWCYKYGYFRHAVKFIRNHVKNPFFVFFTDSASVDWCKDNAKVFGIDFQKEKVLFVDWHHGESSFRDMQLMSYCKHAIITTSSFGWWGAYFIQNPNKITISPYVSIDTTHHCK